ncbi:hypothetical protein A8C56_22015 [Niabella ginsenosidivorans]|uniref:Uncharacterized protein n=1 Tax=Niabella ginsenosidivorans TaxID=1176587 RepID=A0A1A9I9F5_9BACT|nr:DUF6686 family protein [Niabella ginsenosidivorans]ANH83301.1 hypothetical protein A8C56_22015 [Niabella ginsenosidivorans]
MCTFKTLYYEEDGYLIFCSECMHFQLAFQTSLLTLAARDLHILHALVKENYEYHCFEPVPYRKNIYIPTPLEGYGMILDQAELAQLFHLLETAEVNYKAESLLELFKTA